MVVSHCQILVIEGGTKLRSPLDSRDPDGLNYLLRILKDSVPQSLEETTQYCLLLLGITVR